MYEYEHSSNIKKNKGPCHTTSQSYGWATGNEAANNYFTEHGPFCGYNNNEILYLSTMTAVAVVRFHRHLSVCLSVCLSAQYLKNRRS